ncbi:LppX_LprAFG lipoprotein [Amycolatopsis alba]|uniref:LppX_LprAFG lipoprotein n=1 Tax=Amycolatopsis alba DSM 44262 TaxID=1125972 RepID=A0A229RBK7_AMYAL|nr:LppX_LprAFG lipoprotein [Amycolatopsis alba]OXM44040.1 LppX_LprAFG lipoprotein [Amycolatopsis alba DSM 44262]
MRCRHLVPALLLTIGLIGGCAGSPALPPAQEFVSAAADSLVSLRSVRFTLGVNGVVTGLPVRALDGDVSLEDGAVGNADLQDDFERVKVKYRLYGSEITLSGPDGERVVPATEPYTPQAMLGAGGGLRRLLTGATELRGERWERVQDTDSFRIAAKVPAAVIGGIVPEIKSDVFVKLWISKDEPRRLVRVWLQVPPTSPQDFAVMLELALTRHNAVVVGGGR